MNLQARVEFERQLGVYVKAVAKARDGCACSWCIEQRGLAHNARCDLVTWVSVYTAQQCLDAVAEARLNSGPIADTSGGP